MLEQNTTSLLHFGAGKHHASESPGCACVAWATRVTGRDASVDRFGRRHTNAAVAINLRDRYVAEAQSDPPQAPQVLMERVAPLG